jgi:ribosomal protein S7
MAIRTTQTFTIPAGKTRFFKSYAPLRTRLLHAIVNGIMVDSKTVTANADGSHVLKIVNDWATQDALNEFDAYVSTIQSQIDAYNTEHGITKSERTTETV